MELAALVTKFREALEARYTDWILPSHRRAMDAITRCRTPEAGEVLSRCVDCGRLEWHPCSCGHRSCPKCQNHDTTRWLERQREKLLPVEYFLVTFTLPAELRALAWSHQREVYDALFAAASQTIKDFGKNDRHLGVDLGFSAVLHTHSRRITYHPHVHIVVPAGGVARGAKQWKKTPGDYLFHQSSMASVFRGKLYHELEGRGLEIPSNVPVEWVVDCSHVGRGETALEYLSRYLYRGVISEANILFAKDGLVTFRYTDWQSKVSRTETLTGVEFLRRILLHVLPRGFHRVRDYGLLHHSARKTLRWVQYALRVRIPAALPARRPHRACSDCGGEMTTLGMYRSGEVARIRATSSHRQEGVAC